MKEVIYNEITIKTFKGEAGIPDGDYPFLSPHVLGKYRHYAGDLVNRFGDEIRARLVFTVSHNRATYFESVEPLFGDDVFNAFPSANDDIAEAGACLALDRGTACVMHLMRAVEVGLAALAATLGVPKKNDWGGYLRGISQELATRATASRARSEDEQFYSEAAASFDYLRRAWRNPTMHVEKSYSAERATEIFEAVKSFMRHLAMKISE